MSALMRTAGAGSARRARPLSHATLLATGCGTAIAAVCALGLLQVQRLAPGLWSVAAVLLAGAICRVLAGALCRMGTVLPTGAGLLAYLSRGLGRRAGLLLVMPYLSLTLFLVGTEATLVGRALHVVVPLPPWIFAGLFLIGTWALCRAGLCVGYVAQALATWILIAGLSLLSLAALWQAGAAAPLALWHRLVMPAPPVLDLVAAVGQSLFLFMGFELLTSQSDLAPPPAVGAALRGSVVLLGCFYGLLALGFSCLTPGAAADPLLPQLAMAAQGGGRAAVLAVVLLTVLASFTSFNGALLTLSRFTAALAGQGILPRSLGRVQGRSLAPRPALLLLLGLSLLATLLVGRLGALAPSILSAAVGAAVVYAAVLWARERPLFAEASRPVWRVLLGQILALCLLGLAAGVVIDAGHAVDPLDPPGPVRQGTLLLLAVVYGCAAGQVLWRTSRWGLKE